MTETFQKSFESEIEAKRFYSESASEHPTLVLVYSNRDSKFYLEADESPFIRNGEKIIRHRICGKEIKSK